MVEKDLNEEVNQERGSKYRILCLEQILLKKTDEEHPLSTNQLIKILKEEYGISTHRNTISKDIKILEDLGLDIVTIVSTQNKYFVGTRLFEIPELAVLINIIEASGLLTEKKTNILVEKICQLVSEHQLLELKKNTFMMHAPKADNENIYYVMATIDEAIKLKKQISFQCFTYSKDKEKIICCNVNKFSPYKFLIYSDKAFIIGYSEEENRIIDVRLEYIMGVPEILTDDINTLNVKFDIVQYLKNAFNIFAGGKKRVKLKCDNEVLGEILKWVGYDAQVKAVGNRCSQVSVELTISPAFFGWLFGFDGQVIIEGPDEVRKKYLEMLKKWGGDKLLDG